MSSWTCLSLAGGLPLLLQQRPGVGLVAARLWIRGGSSRDPVGGRGAMQLLAGVMTRGCGALTAEQLADLVEGRGAALRCEAHEDALVISLKCASDDASELLPLLLAMAREPGLAPEQVQLERQLNLQSLQRQREDPFQLAHDGLRELLYASGPYGHDPLGVEAELEQLTAAALAPLVDDLGRQGALLAVCGDLPAAADLQGQLNRQLGLTPWQTALPVPQPTTAAGTGVDPVLLCQDTEQVVVMLGAATVPLGHPDALALRLLQAHFGLGMSSRLFVVMREERGLAYDVGVHLPARCGPSPFVWHCSSSTERAGEAMAALLEEWQRQLETPLSTAELSLARAKFRGQDAMGRQTCGQIADRQALVMGHGLGDGYVARSLLAAEQLSADDLLAAARRHLAEPSLSLCGAATAVAAAEAVWSSWSSRAALPPATSGSR
ncbi:pitrilysin family protein [Cyanobium sp. LEGE 06113]|uniref:M16 family metallopeptidase n=1 Tax=Cyanobium sp. LEGE 06113 TaxID=1297573 RepID=UPI0018813622|nr:pitrilysin family protein [Cyanobium sp. LEGE 06113]MBE9153541.1 insulinase family protein [Cyanobium sp. LEGE 06113]